MVSGVVGLVVGGVGEISFGMGATAARVGGFVAREGLVVFGVGVVVGRGVVDVKTLPILLIAINTTDKVSDMLMGSVECFILVADVAEGVVSLYFFSS